MVSYDAKFATLVEKVHSHGALAGVSLWHGGNKCSNLLSRQAPLGVSSYPMICFYLDTQARPALYSPRHKASLILITRLISILLKPEPWRLRPMGF